MLVKYNGYDMKKLSHTQFQAIQRKHELSIWSKNNEKDIDTFAFEFKPQLKF